MNIVLDWILAAWLFISAGIAGGAAFYVVSKWKTLPMPRRICGVFVVILVFHMAEEYIYPGGFQYIFNTMYNSANPAAYPLNELSCMVTNFVAVLFFAFVLWKWGERVWVTLTIAIFGIAQLAVHSVLGFASFGLFAQAGQALPYSPGLFNSAFLLLPLSVYCFVHLAKSKSLSMKHARASLKEIGIAIVTVIVIVAGLIMLPMQALGNDPDTVFTFDSNGYYDRFLE